jgi:YD repeat-containing protein
VDFTWNGTQLIAVREPDGNSYSYTYFANRFGSGLNRLSSTIRPGVPTTTITYHYELPEDASALTGKSFDGLRYSQFGYDADANATSTEHNGIEKYIFSYSPIGRDAFKVEELNPLGKTATYTFNAGKLRTTTGHPSTSCPSESYSEIVYDLNGYPLIMSDFSGHDTKYTYSDGGQLLEKVEAYGTPVARTTHIDWDTQYNRIREVAVTGVVKRVLEYGPLNRLSRITETNLSTSGVANQTRQTWYNYSYYGPVSGTAHAVGMVANLTVDGPLPGFGDEVIVQYDTLGNLVSVTDGLGHATIYGKHNGRGQPGRITGANGSIVEYVYDPRGRLTAKKPWRNGAWQPTYYFYDAMDHVIGIRMPDGHWQVRTYDIAGRLATQYEPEVGGTYAQIRYTYNNASLPTRIDTERVSGATLPAPPVAPVNLTTAPALTAPATNVTGSYLVSWNAVAGATLYKLEESAGNGSWAPIQNATTTSMTLTSKGSGTYNYRVTACNSGGCGPVSVVGSTAVNVQAPSAPALSGPATFLTTRNYTVTWGSVTTATSYQLEEKMGGVWAQIYNGAGTSMAFSGKVNGNYSYQVKACNANGCGAYSTIRTITVEFDACSSCFMAPEPDPEASITTGDNGDAA